MNKRQRKKREYTKNIISPMSHRTYRQRCRKCHEYKVKENQMAKLLILTGKKHTTCVEDAIIACYYPPKYRRKTIHKILSKDFSKKVKKFRKE